MFLTDEEMEAIETGGMSQGQTEGTQLVHQPQPPAPIPLYPLSIAQQGPGLGANGVPQQGAPAQGWALKTVGGLPVWGWGLVAAGVGAAGFFYWRGRKLTQNPGESESKSSGSSGGGGNALAAALMNTGSRDSGWSPSRSRMAEQLERYFQKKGLGPKVKVWVDADDAHEKGGLKQVSPLVNVEVFNNGFKVDQAFTRFCRREGLNPVQHPDGNIGLYPHSTKRGKEWEEYVDALRDEGQKV